MRQVYRRLFSRDPDSVELKLALEFLTGHDWLQYARVLLGANEFLFVN